MTIKESLRLCNPVISIGRQLDKPMTLKSKLMRITEFVLPKKSEIQVHLSALSVNPHVWDNPKVRIVIEKASTQENPFS